MTFKEYLAQELSTDDVKEPSINEFNLKGEPNLKIKDPNNSLFREMGEAK